MECSTQSMGCYPWSVYSPWGAIECSIVHSFFQYTGEILLVYI